MEQRFSVFILVTIFLSVVLFESVSCRLTEKQVAATLKLVRNMCVGRSKATAEEIDKTHQGIWEIDHNAKCFLHCVFHTNKLMDDNNNFDLNGLEAQKSQLPESMVDHVVKSVTSCAHAATNLGDKCVAAWEYAKCIHDVDPSKYFLP